ncbi:MAG: menaquinone biosynthesis protein [Planctomycetota bacterium]
MTHNRPILTDRHIRPPRIGCVSYLNAKPLIHGLAEAMPGCPLTLKPPAELLQELEDGRCDLALCPVIDAQRSALPLRIVPAGGIGCDGPTLTVRLFAGRPFDQVRRIRADPESHTSVALLRCLWHARYGAAPELAPLPLDHDPLAALQDDADAVLLIGDKVVPQLDRVPQDRQLDLGEAWKQETGLPFVFAVWVAREQAQLGEVPEQLAGLLEVNLSRVDALAKQYADQHGWPVLLAQRYLGALLRYRVGERELQAIHRFYGLCKDAGVLSEVRPVATAVPTEHTQPPAKRA